MFIHSGNQGGRLSGGFEEDPQSGSSSLVTDGAPEEATYKPSAVSLDNYVM